MPTWIFFDSFKTNTINGTEFIDFDTDAIKVALVTSTLAPDIDVHNFWDDLVANEVSGTNYTTRGTALTSRTINEAGGVVTFDAADITWTQSGAGFSTARYSILYKDTTVNATSPLVAYLDFTSDKGNVSGDLILQMDAAGLFTLGG